MAYHEFEEVPQPVEPEPIEIEVELPTDDDCDGTETQESLSAAIVDLTDSSVDQSGDQSSHESQSYEFQYLDEMTYPNTIVEAWNDYHAAGVALVSHGVGCESFSEFVATYPPGVLLRWVTHEIELMNSNAALQQSLQSAQWP